MAQSKKIKIMALAVLGAFVLLFLGYLFSSYQRDSAVYERFGPYLGDYRFEVIEGKMGQKIGDVISVRIEKGELVIRGQKKDAIIWLTPTSPDTFKIQGRELEMEFKRNMAGIATQIVARPNKLGVFFTLQRLKD